MMGVAASHVRCSSCGALTAIGDAESASPTACSNCGADGDLAAVAVIPCPDSFASYPCRAAAHDDAAGGHIVEVD